MKEKIAADIRDSIKTKEIVLATMTGEIERAARMIHDCLKAGKKVLFFGNGGSASDSQHLAAEFVGRYERERRGYPAIALTTDTSILTAVGNDYGFDRVFERQIEALGEPGDVAVGISTSGNSPNVVKGIEKAKAKGLKTIILAGKDGGKLKAMADLALVVPVSKTARIQESHIMIGHILCERADENLPV